MIGLLRRIERLGGSEDQLIALAGADNELVDWIARMIVQTDGGRKMDRPYKNWPAICDALRSNGQINKSIVWANALANINGELARRFVLAFPEFWSETEVQGPVPWSVLCETAKKNVILNGGPADNWQHMWLWEALEFDVPVRELVAGHYDGLPDWAEMDKGAGKEVWIRPACIPLNVVTGMRVEWRGSHWIVIENCEGQDRIVIVPAQCIAMDL